MLKIALNLHLRQVFLGSVLKTQKLSYISASLSGVTATPDMSLKWGIIVVSSTHQSERVEKSFLLCSIEHGEPFLARESQNGFLKIIICGSRREKMSTEERELRIGADMEKKVTYYLETWS